MKTKSGVVVETMPLDCGECGEYHTGDEYEVWYAAPLGRRGKCPGDMVPNSVKIANVTRRKDGEKFMELLTGKTYMQFEVGLAPARGSFDVWVSTKRRGTTDDEFRDMLLGFLAEEAVKSV